jgi:acyl-CoA synthetase (AMP-forming)/AMP-acid ligase II
VCIPELDALLDDSPCELYPYKKTFEEAKLDPCFVIHTSGSTGLPVPVLCTHWSISTTDQHHLVSPLDGKPSVWGAIFDTRRRNYLAWPISSSSGISAGITDVCFNNITSVFGPPEQATADIIDKMIEFADIDSASCVPATLEELARYPNVLAKLWKLKHIAYAGGNEDSILYDNKY